MSKKNFKRKIIFDSDINIQSLNTTDRELADPTLGRLVFDTTEQKMYVGNGSIWVIQGEKGDPGDPGEDAASFLSLQDPLEYRDWDAFENDNAAAPYFEDATHATLLSGGPVEQIPISDVETDLGYPRPPIYGPDGQRTTYFKVDFTNEGPYDIEFSFRIGEYWNYHLYDGNPDWLLTDSGYIDNSSAVRTTLITSDLWLNPDGINYVCVRSGLNNNGPLAMSEGKATRITTRQVIPVIFTDPETGITYNLVGKSITE